MFNLVGVVCPFPRPLQADWGELRIVVAQDAPQSGG
jgi:hypothetical protein